MATRLPNVVACLSPFGSEGGRDGVVQPLASAICSAAGANRQLSRLIQHSLGRSGSGSESAQDAEIMLEVVVDGLHYNFRPHLRVWYARTGVERNETARRNGAVIELHKMPSMADSDALTTLCNALQACCDGRNLNTGSALTFELASTWLDICLKTHSSCRAFQGTGCALPTRVIDVRLAGDDRPPCLLETGGGEGRYITLSHCWGGADVLHTTSQTLAERKTSIPLSSMPGTFRDAVLVARSFGIRYLWIDSLCIVQDSAEDWERESSRMGAVFRGALFTVAAQHASSSAGGCFIDRTAAAAVAAASSKPVLLRLGMDGGLTNPSSGTIMCASAAETGAKSAATQSRSARSALDWRAWVLQEQVLSTRTLQYHERCISWHCLCMDSSELEAAGMSRLRDYDHIGALQTSILCMATSSPDRPPESRYWDTFHDAWYRIVEDYTLRRLTVASDRLIAISGITHAVQQATGDTYLAGLWRNWLYTDLLWNASAGSSRIQPAIAPSWSWASVTGKIQWFHVDYSPAIGRPRMRCLVDVLQAHVHGSAARQAGFIRLRGDARAMFIDGADFFVFREADRRLGWRVFAPSDVRSLGVKWRSDEPLPPCSLVFILAVAEDDNVVHCLGLARAKSGRAGHYRRIGIATCRKLLWYTGFVKSTDVQERQLSQSGSYKDRLKRAMWRRGTAADSSLPAESEYLDLDRLKRGVFMIS